MGGAYLSRPVTDKISEDGKNSRIAYGVSSMQGWRLKQEDAHTCAVDFDQEMSLFGVYDGHGGFEVAKYTAEKFPNFLRDNEKYKQQNFEAALIEAFLGFDDTIATPEVMSVLQEMVDAAEGKVPEGDGLSEAVVGGGSFQAGCSSHGDDHDEDLETPESLRADASKPIEEVLASYHLPNIHALKYDSTKPASPCLRGRRGLGNGSSDGAACSSSAVKSDTNAVAEPLANEDEFSDKNSRIIPNEETSEETTSGCSSGAGKEEETGLVNGVVNGSVSEEVETGEKRSKRISAGSPSSENSRPSGTPGTSPKKTKKLALDDLDDSTVIKNFITNEEIADDDEEDSEDETFQPTDEPLDSDDDVDEDNYELSENSRAQRFLKCFGQMIKNDLTNKDDDEDDSEDDYNYEDNDSSSSHSDKSDTEAEATEENESDEDEEENSDEEAADDDDIEEDEMACAMLSNMGGDERPGIDSGCTAVVALFKGRDVYVANAGDSRCIVCKAGKAVDMSEDHKPEDKIEYDRIVKAGGHVSREGRVNDGLNLSRAIGDHCYKERTDLPNTEQMITALPDVRTIKLEPDVEFLVLACDGIWNSMTSQQVVDFVRPKIQQNERLSEICEQLFNECLAPNTSGDGTGCDNMTCIIVKPLHGEGETLPAESNGTKNTDLETSEVCVTSDANASASNQSERVVVPENGIAQADDKMKKNGTVAAANGDEKSSNSLCSGDSTTTITSQPKVQKRCSVEVDADGDCKRQKTDDAELEST